MIALIGLMLAAPLQAEMGGEGYRSGAGGLSAEERAAARARLAEQIAAERARAEEAARRARDEAARVAVERAALPRAERLIEARCRTCHDRGQIDAAPLGTLGWSFTVIRMDLLNGARLAPGEGAEIVRHLAARNPERTRLEWAVAAGAGATILLLLVLALRRRRKRGRGR